jgi:hypothetical protein
MKKQVKVVVARYNENLKWIEPLIDICVIYNKGVDDIPYEYKRLPNVGKEGESYLRYIIDNYDDLPDYVAFTQGEIIDHVSDYETFYLSIIAVENGFGLPSGYRGLNERCGYHGWNYIKDFTDPYHPGLPMREFWRRIYKIDPIDNAIVCNYCGIFIVSRENIHFNPVSFYIKLYQILMEDHETNGYILERLWTTIFDEDYKGKAI